ncbi:MAG: hypothetical protein AAF907_09850, partial [Planctomycetota bacterium]
MADSSVRPAPAAPSAAGLKDERPSTATDRYAICPSCGERVRPGLVRLWRCGSFMRDDVANRYEELNRKRTEVVYRPLPELTNDGQYAAVPDAGRARRTSDDDADFEFAGEFVEADDDGSFAAADAGAVSGSPTADVLSEGSDEPPADAPAAEVAESPERTAPPEPDVPHSEATGGDALLEIARSEDKKPRGGRRRGLRVKGDSILLYCTGGYPIKVKRKHAGKVGRCPYPACGCRYLVPDVLPEAEEETTEPAASADGETPERTADPVKAPDELAVGAFTRYLDGVRLHAVLPPKVKQKADSQAKTFQEADLALSSDTLLVITVEGKKGSFGLGGEKPEAVRAKVREHLGKPEAELSELPAPHLLLAGENAAEIAVEYPADLPHESKFSGEAVFGTGRIALGLPLTGAEDDADQPEEKRKLRFVSMTLSQYRRFADAMEEFGFATNYGASAPIPRTDEGPVHTGHYTDAPVPELVRPDLYEADPKLDVEIAGYRCQSCGMVVSEDGRKKEKLGGANGKGLAKAKCPKCGDKFGREPLF